MQVEDVRKAICGNARCVSSGRRSIDCADVVGHAVGVVSAGDTEVNAAITTAQCRRPHAGVLDRLPAQLEEQTLLGIQQGGFSRRYAKKMRIETRHIANGTGRKRVRGARMFFAGVQIRILVPAIRLYLCDKIPPIEQIKPISLGIGLRKTEREPHDGNTLCHVFLPSNKQLSSFLLVLSATAREIGSRYCSGGHAVS